ncbi:MAG: DUF4093 domain-containing protein [Oscillospiraceae bacterium]|nr:DUF4093 domain-containing protein [Oscillospiraceae bacterium]
MNRPVIKEAIVVEGRYDKNTLSQIVDALIIVTDGFQLYKNADTRRAISCAAERTGIIILTDSDASGFQIRSRIKAFVPAEQIKNAYIPDMYGKEKRKSAPGKEGKLGVEGMSREVLLKSLRDAGATFLPLPSPHGEGGPSNPYPLYPASSINVSDLYAAGLTGFSDSKEKRTRFLRNHGLPEHLGTQAAAAALSRIMSREAFYQETGTDLN